MTITDSIANPSTSALLKKKFRRAMTFCLIGSIFWSMAAWRVPAQKDRFSDSKNTEKLVDAYTTVLTMAYPPAGGALAVAKEMMTALGFFKQPDLVGEAIKQLNQRLDAIEGRVDKLENEIVSTRNEGRENANLENVRALRALREKLEDILVKLGRKPTDQFAKDDLAREAERVANNLLEDSKLWEWSDQAIKDHTWEGKFVKAGTFLDRDFKPMPTLEIYQAALGLWMATIENASGGKKDVIANTYGNALQRHSAFLQVRPNWDELNGVPQTLPEKIKSRVSAIYVPTTTLPDSNQMCTVVEYLKDDMAREVKPIGVVPYVARYRNELCNVATNFANRASPSELALEEAYGVDSMTFLAQKMDQLKRTGTLREQFIGTFDTNSKADDFNILYTVSPDGTLTWRRHLIKYRAGSKYQSADSALTSPKTVGTGWASGVRDVLPIGQMGIYGLKDDGTLTWYWHEGFADGTFEWRDSRDIAKGLTGFTQIVAQDEGVLYGRIQGDPGIFWGITKNYDAKKGPPSASIGFRLTSETINFAAFRIVFGGGKGVLYAIDYAGNLLWMRHNNYLSPLPDPPVKLPGSAEYQLWRAQWSGPVVIGTGFTHITKAFSPGEGHIYYVTDKGRLIWRQHAGWENGTDKWNGVSSSVIADDWGDYKFAFARNTTSDLGSGNPKLEIIVH